MATNRAYKLWTTNEIRLLKKYFSCTPSKDITNLFPGRSLNSIKLAAIKFGLRKSGWSNGKKYEVNENFFQLPNINNSYWAGFIAARFILSICGNKPVLEYIKKWFDFVVPVKNLSCVHKCKNIFQYAISGSRAIKIVELLSKINTPKLARKWSKLEQYKEMA